MTVPTPTWEDKPHPGTVSWASGEVPGCRGRHRPRCGVVRSRAALPAGSGSCWALPTVPSIPLAPRVPSAVQARLLPAGLVARPPPETQRLNLGQDYFF